jgi:AcrR family transcriptional regulator
MCPRVPSARYFPNKEAAIGALMEETSDRVAAALSRQPHDITELEALVRAHTEVFRAAQRGEPDAMSFDRISGLLSIVNNTPMLGLASLTFRPDGSLWQPWLGQDQPRSGHPGS